MIETPTSTTGEGNFAAVEQRVPSPLVHPLGDNKLLIEILSEVLDHPREVVRQILYEEEQDLGVYQRTDFQKCCAESGVWSDGIVQFYQRSNAFLYGGVVWNRRPAKLALRQWIGNYLVAAQPPDARVLTIGDGPGFDSLFLSKCGFQVTFSELSVHCIEFARRLFALNRAPIDVVDNQDAIEEGCYDVVMCLDVLEHVPEPEELVAQFARYLRPGGQLVVHAPFFFVSPHNPTHLKSNKKYSGDLSRLYGLNGFELIDGRFFWDPLVFVKRRNGERAASNRPFWRAVLRTSGLLLSVGRVWSMPHNMAGAAAMRRKDPQWLKGLEPPAK